MSGRDEHKGQQNRANYNWTPRVPIFHSAPSKEMEGDGSAGEPAVRLRVGPLALLTIVVFWGMYFLVEALLRVNGT